MVSGMMKKTMITLVLLGCAFLLPAQTKTTVQGRIENAENLRLYYYLNEESYPVSVDGDGRYNIELDLSDFTIIKFSPLTFIFYLNDNLSLYFFINYSSEICNILPVLSYA